MDVFQVRDRLIEDYQERFVDIHDQRIREHVDEGLANGYQWPAVAVAESGIVPATSD